MMKRFLLSLLIAAAFSSCTWMSTNAKEHQENLQAWDSRREYDPATGKYFHSSDVHNVPVPTSFSEDH